MNDVKMPRPKPEIDQLFTVKCAQLGNLEYNLNLVSTQHQQFTAQKKHLIDEIADLNKEGLARQRLDEAEANPVQAPTPPIDEDPLDTPIPA